MTEITIGDVRPFVQYQADGVQSAFTYPFPILAAGDLVVVFDDGAAAAGHTIAGVGDAGGGSVTFDAPPPAGTRITLYRDMPVERTTDFVEAGEFRASALNAELDRLAMMLQQVEASGGNALRRAAHDEDGPLELPPRAQRFNTVLGFDDAGWPETLPDPAIAVADAFAHADAAAQSASNAANSQSAAGDSAAQAAQDRTAAETAAANAATSAGDAAASESAAANSTTAAGDAEAKAQQWADAAPNVEVEPDAFSARHWANEAAAEAASFPDERWRVDLAVQRVRWFAFAPAISRPPAWAVDFLLGLGLDGLVVSRGGPATYHDALGNLVTAGDDELRLDHDPATLAPLGALIEPARTNHLYDSFNPVTQTRTLPAGTYTLSVTGSGGCRLTSGPTGTATQGAPVTFTLAVDDAVGFVVEGSLDAFQCEDGGTVTSLIETPPGANATRPADVVTAADLGGVNVAALSAVVSARLADVPASGGARLLSLDAGGDADRHNLYWDGANDRASLFSKALGASQGSLSGLVAGWSDGETHTLAMAAGGGARKLFADGAKAGEDAITDPLAATVLRVGAFHNGEQWGGHVRRVAIWNAVLSDADLATLTG